jgi:hypothetical protein
MNSVAEVLELVNSFSVAEVSDSGVKVFDSHIGGDHPPRVVLDLDDAVQLAKVVLAFAEPWRFSEEALQDAEEAKVAESIRRWEEAYDARMGALSAHWGHD